jgi:hypothetical protein
MTSIYEVINHFINDIINWLSIIGTPSIIAILTLIGGVLALIIFVEFAPVLRLHISPTWVNANGDLLNLRIEIENKSRVRIYNPEIYLQVLEHSLPKKDSLSEWVPFSKERILQDERSRPGVPVLGDA